MKQDEAESLARKIRPRTVNDLAFTDPFGGAIFARDLCALCDYILSGSLKREIENAAFDKIDELIFMWPVSFDQAGPLREAIRALIQPPAQKDATLKARPQRQKVYTKITEALSATEPK